MTGWKRSVRLPARLTRWIKTLHSALDCWSWPYRWLHDASLTLSQVRRQMRQPVRFGLEVVEDRILLDANPLGLTTAVLGGDLAQLRKDVTTSIAVLENAVPSSPANTPTPAAEANQWNKAVSVLAADFGQMQQAFVHFEFAVWTSPRMVSAQKRV